MKEDKQPKKNYNKKTSEEIKQEATELLANIDKEIEKLFMSDDMKERQENYRMFLNGSVTLYKYSANNQILIKSQLPNATDLKTFNAWKSEGISVAKGQKAIKIIAPLIRKENNEDEIIIGFRALNVFDVSQTNKPLEEVEKAYLFKDDESIVENKDIVINALEKVSNIKFEYSDDLGRFNDGYFLRINNDTEEKIKEKIVLKKSLNDKDLISVAVHEVSHKLLHSKRTDKTVNEEEVEAESVAYVVCKYLGLESNSSLRYLNSYSKDKNFEDLKTHLSDVTRVASTIIKSIEDNLSMVKQLKLENTLTYELTQNETRTHTR